MQARGEKRARAGERGESERESVEASLRSAGGGDFINEDFINKDFILRPASSMNLCCCSIYAAVSVEGSDDDDDTVGGDGGDGCGDG